MLIYEEGDIVNGNYDIFCQQVNCQHKMGSGLARQIRNKYPEVYKAYMDIKDQRLGFIDSVETKDGRICVNMFAQDNYGRDGKCYTNYKAFEACLNAIIGLIEDRHIKIGAKIAFPYKIGCGLGGGNWDIIRDLIDKFSEKVEQDVVIVSLK